MSIELKFSSLSLLDFLGLVDYDQNLLVLNSTAKMLFLGHAEQLIDEAFIGKHRDFMSGKIARLTVSHFDDELTVVVRLLNKF